MKRYFFLFLAVMLVEQAWAEDFVVDNLKYTITDAEKHEVSVGKISDDNSPQGDLVISAEVENSGVTYTVTTIDSNAFNGCIRLTSVTIPNSVTSIGGDAFTDCICLTSVNIIGNSVTSIGVEQYVNWLQNYCRLTAAMPNIAR